MKVDIKYKTQPKGKYWAGVNDCPHCDHKPELVFDHIVGFADTQNGNMCVVQCPKCFKYWMYHSRINENGGGHYFYFLERVKEGKNIHFKNRKQPKEQLFLDGSDLRAPETKEQ